MRGIDLQMAFSLKRQSNMSTSITVGDIDKSLPFRTFAPATQEFPDAISDKDWYGKGDSFASFWDPITKQVVLAAREFSLSNISALFAPAMVLGKLDITNPNSAVPTVFALKFTFQDPLLSEECVYTSMLEKMGGIYERLITGAVIEQFTLTGNRTDHVTIGWQGFARRMESSVQALPSLTPQSFFKTICGTFNFGQSGQALTNLSTKLVSWNLTCNQNPSKWWMPGTAVGQESLLTKAKIGKQGATGQAVVLLESADEKELFENNTECAFQMVLRGDQIGATGMYHQVTIEIPHLKIPSETFGEEQDQVTYTIPFNEQTILKAAGDDYMSITVQSDNPGTDILDVSP